MDNKFPTRLLSLLTVFAIMVSLALVRNGRLWGHDLSATQQPDSIAAVTATGAGSLTVNTTEPGKDISGYAGPVPLKIYISRGRIDSVVPLPNQETPRFFGRVRDNGLLKAWNGKTLPEALACTPDAVTGATFSSQAVIGNVHAGVEKAIAFNGATATAEGASSESEGWSLKTVIAFIVILMGAVVPMFVHTRRMRLIQQFLNVGVLGFWTGTFIDFTSLLHFTSSGLTYSAASVTSLLIFIVGFIYPLFGKGSCYCANVCPLGSLQELAGRLSSRKLRMSHGTSLFLNRFREVLFCALLMMLWTGAGAGWADYELFTGFLVNSAAWSVLTAGLAFIVLSVFIPRPFCRFICPTGTLLRLPSGLRAGSEQSVQDDKTSCRQNPQNLQKRYKR